VGFADREKKHNFLQQVSLCLVAFRHNYAEQREQEHRRIQSVTPSGLQWHGSEQASETNHTIIPRHTHVPPDHLSHRSNVTISSLLSNTGFRPGKPGHFRLKNLTTANQEPSTIIVIIPRSRQAQANELLQDYSGSCSDSPARQPLSLLATSEGWRFLSHKTHVQGQSSRVDG
jgi:hypothetical protein